MKTSWSYQEGSHLLGGGNPHPENRFLQLSEKLIHYIAALNCLFLCAVGVLGLIDCINQEEITLKFHSGKDGWLENSNQGFALLCLSAILIVLGGLGFLSELGWRTWLTRYVTFIAHAFSRGTYYFINGVLALGVAGNIGIIGGIFNFFIATLVWIDHFLLHHYFLRVSYEDV